MIDPEKFRRAVSRIYAASGSPRAWEDALTDVAHILGAAACTITTGDGRQRSIFSTGIDDAAISAYDDYYHRMDFVMATCESDPVGLVRGGWDLVADNRRTEFHVDWQRRFELTDGLTVRLSASPSASFLLSAPPHGQPFATTERVRFVNALVPHLQRALAAQRQLADVTGGYVDIHAAFDVVRHAVFIVGDDGRVIKMNTAARRLLTNPDGLFVRGERVQASTVATDHELQAGISRAFTDKQDSARLGSYVVCGRPSGSRPFIIRIVPIDTYTDPRLAHAAIVIIDPERELTPPKALLQRLFSLTDTEVEVAVRIQRGHELKTISEDLSVAITTVKTHLQRIFAKTGTHRQTELVRLLFAIAS